MQFTLGLKQEADRRWIAEVRDVPGVIANGETPGQAADKAISLAIEALASRKPGDAVALLQSWIDADEEEAQEQRETGEILQRALRESRR